MRKANSVNAWTTVGLSCRLKKCSFATGIVTSPYHLNTGWKKASPNIMTFFNGPSFWTWLGLEGKSWS
jgi:hypothetical protein